MPQSATPTSPRARSTRGVWAVVALGVVVFVGLWFAPRTVLQGSRGPAATAAPELALPQDLALLADFPDGPDGQALRGLWRQYDQAKTNTEQAPALDKLVAASVNAGRYDLAARFQDRLVRLDGQNNPEAQLKLARLYSQASELPSVQEAPQRSRQITEWGLSAWDAVVAANPQSKDAQLERALLNVRSGDPQRMMSQGILAIRALADQHPDYLRAQIELGRFSLQTQQYDKAESRFRTAIKAHPEQPEPHFYLAQTLALQGRRAEARAAYEQALAKKPTAEMARAARVALDTLR